MVADLSAGRRASSPARCGATSMGAFLARFSPSESKKSGVRTRPMTSENAWFRMTKFTKRVVRSCAFLGVAHLAARSRHDNTIHREAASTSGASRSRALPVSIGSPFLAFLTYSARKVRCAHSAKGITDESRKNLPAVDTRHSMV
jgi:hypothetical protein